MIKLSERASQVVLMGKNLSASAGDIKRHRFNTWVRKIPWRKARQPSPVFLPGESDRQTSLVGYTVLRVTQSWTQLKRLSMHAHTFREAGNTKIFHLVEVKNAFQNLTFYGSFPQKKCTYTWRQNLISNSRGAQAALRPETSGINRKEVSGVRFGFKSQLHYFLPMCLSLVKAFQLFQPLLIVSIQYCI